MNAHIKGSKDWWAVVLTMPHQEALMHLKDYKRQLLEVAAGTPEYLRVGHQITRINDETKRINTQLNHDAWWAACKNILSPDLFEAVIAEKRRIEASR